MAAWMGGEFGGTDACTYMNEPLCCPPETITTLLIGYILMQNEKLKNKGWVSAIHWPILYLSKYPPIYLNLFSFKIEI